MAPRPFWKGYLKLSLVTCPVAMTPAITEGSKVKFHTLNRATGHRIESAYVDAGSGKPVDEGDLVKGYQTGASKFMILEDQELESVAIESTRTIDIDMFVPKESIDLIWYDHAHYLVPDDPVGEEAFSVIRDAMQATGMAGISRLVLYSRERAVMLYPRGRGIVLWTLHYGSDVRDPSIYFGDIKTPKVNSELKGLLTALIAERTKLWSSDMAGDPVQKELLQTIAEKRGDADPKKRKRSAEPMSNVINIMDALRRSISSENTKPKGR